MKKWMILSIFMASAIYGDSQTQGSGAASSQAAKAGTQAKKSDGVKYHGSKDTTPGSPMGSGGAGGNEMSGSPKGSASEAVLQSNKPNQPVQEQGGTEASKTKKANTKGAAPTNKNKPM